LPLKTKQKTVVDEVQSWEVGSIGRRDILQPYFFMNFKFNYVNEPFVLLIILRLNVRRYLDTSHRLIRFFICMITVNYCKLSPVSR
jgi:hypothetical protein